MFKEPTVFILGAGASWHYGYPTGEELVKKVIEKASVAARYFDCLGSSDQTQRPDYLGDGDITTNSKTAHEQCVKLKAGLEQVKPPVVDYYLGWNSSLENIGRLLIAWVILECEHESRDGRNINRRPRPPIGQPQPPDDWCRFVIHQLAVHCKESKDLLSNRVSFITFNYDVSLEQTLTNSLGHIALFNKNDVTQFLGGSRVIHIYGKVRDKIGVTVEIVDWDVQNQDPKGFGSARLSKYFTDMQRFLNAVYAASKGLRVIDPHDKGAYDDEITIARTAVGQAKRVFILGYGFDEHNSDRLCLREYLANSVASGYQSVAFTNFRDINQINKRVSKLFYGHTRNFPSGGYALADRYEKSIRDTYDALAMDFDLAE